MRQVRRLGLLVLALAVVGSAYAVDKASTWEGTLVDSKCYLMDKQYSGNDHGTIKHCGTMCLKAGTPGALLTKDNHFYPLLAPSIALAPYVGKQIRVTGRVVSGAIDVDKAELNESGQWKPIKLGSMM